MNDLDPKTFDLADFFAGVNRPEIEVPIYLDETVGFGIYQKQREIQEAEAKEDKKGVDKLKKELDALLKDAEKSRFVVTVRSIPAEVQRSIMSESLKNFPVEADVWGREKPNLERAHSYTVDIWTAMLTKIVNPDGATTLVGQAEAKNLQDNAPVHALNRIQAAIDELAEGSNSGFDAAVGDTDFLSNA